MDRIREWAIGLCTAGIGCSLLHLLCPSGSLQKLFKTLTAVFFAVCLLSPLQAIPHLFENMSIQLSTQEPDGTLAEKTQEQITSLINEKLTEQARQLTAKYGITVKKVEVKRDTSREDNIYIERITVTVDKQDYPIEREVYTVLEQAFGTIVEVQYVG
ncbi:MAG: hypothetical protein ACI39E_08390 [Acutalibacteraceae bacterium]